MFLVLNKLYFLNIFIVLAETDFQDEKHFIRNVNVEKTERKIEGMNE